MHRPLTFAGCAAWASLLAGCPGETTTPPPPDPVFSADWETAYLEVRGCRKSADHDLRYVRIWADSLASGPYTDRDHPFPDQAVILKSEYEDPACGELVGITAMRREAGFDPEGGDWRWQAAGADGVVVEDGALGACRSCHVACGVPPEGFDGTCAAP